LVILNLWSLFSRVWHPHKMRSEIVSF
jgi:hypothetical protein